MWFKNINERIKEETLFKVKARYPKIMESKSISLSCGKYVDSIVNNNKKLD